MKFQKKCNKKQLRNVLYGEDQLNISKKEGGSICVCVCACLWVDKLVDKSIWLCIHIYIIFSDDIPLNTSLTSQGVIPGMGPEDKVEEAESTGPETIPGLDFDSTAFDR